MIIHLVRHGLPTPHPTVRRFEWALDPGGLPHIDALRRSGALPMDSAWYASPERRAVETARALAGDAPRIASGLREQDRGDGWVEDFDAVVLRAFTSSSISAVPGWESADGTRSRIVGATERILEEVDGGSVVLVGHGFALTLLVAHLTNTPPDVEAWKGMAMPDHCAIENRRLASRWGAWTQS